MDLERSGPQLIELASLSCYPLVADAKSTSGTNEANAGTIINNYEVEYSAEPISRSMTAANQIMCVHSTML
jgi:hypothetical protein